MTGDGLFYTIPPSDVTTFDAASGFAVDVFSVGSPKSGPLIIAFSGSDPVGGLFDVSAFATGSLNADEQIFAGKDPSAAPGSPLDTADNEALRFVLKIQQDNPHRAIYVDGHSLGGYLAEFVASKDHAIAGGDTFGAPGLIGQGPNDGNLIDYVDANDPVGNYATDGALGSFTGEANKNFNHYGQVSPLAGC
jgi:hypothetical protein